MHSSLFVPIGEHLSICVPLCILPIGAFGHSALDVRVTGGSAERIARGDWGEAVMLELAYKHPGRFVRLSGSLASRLS